MTWAFIAGAIVFGSGALFGWSVARASLADILDRYDED